MGTPSYMAPEQAFGQTRDVGPGADIWSLGAILYECLTGSPPFRGTTVADTLDQVRYRDPVPPSQLQPKLPRDLEVICLKCLEKPVHKRYGGAALVADDLQRFLDGQPILARPTPIWERALKWTRRRPVVAASLALVLVAAVAFFWMWAHFTLELQSETSRAQKSEQNEIQQRKAAETNRKAAEASLDEMLKHMDHVMDRLNDKRFKNLPGFEELNRELLAGTAARLEELLAGADDPDPAVRRKASYAYYRLGKIHRQLGDEKANGEVLHKALPMQRRLVADFGGQIEIASRWRRRCTASVSGSTSRPRRTTRRRSSIWRRPWRSIAGLPTR
jgi:hypothetical protein